MAAGAKKKARKKARKKATKQAKKKAKKKATKRAKKKAGKKAKKQAKKQARKKATKNVTKKARKKATKKVKQASGSGGPVLVGTDFSPTARLALERGAEAAARRGVEVVIVHALSPQPVAMGTPSHIVLPPSLDAEVRKASTRRLEALSGEAAGRGVGVRTSLVTGASGQSLVDVAQEEGAGLIAVGTRGLSGLEHLLMGSTAETVVRRAPCPVLSVHPADAKALAHVRIVVVPCELAEDPAPAVDALVDRLGLDPSSLHLILLYSDHLPAVLQPLIEDIGIDRIGFEEVEPGLRERLEPKAAALRERGFDVEVAIREGEPAHVIVDEARRVGADLISMETRGHTGVARLFLGSTAERVVQHAPCPVLSVHRPRD